MAGAAVPARQAWHFESHPLNPRHARVAVARPARSANSCRPGGASVASRAVFQVPHPAISLGGPSIIAGWQGPPRPARPPSLAERARFPRPCSRRCTARAWSRFRQHSPGCLQGTLTGQWVVWLSARLLATLRECSAWHASGGPAQLRPAACRGLSKLISPMMPASAAMQLHIHAHTTCRQAKRAPQALAHARPAAEPFHSPSPHPCLAGTRC